MERNTEYGRLSPVVETFRNEYGHGWVRFFRRVWIMRHRHYVADLDYWNVVIFHFGKSNPLALAEPGLQLRWSGSLKEKR